MLLTVYLYKVSGAVYYDFDLSCCEGRNGALSSHSRKRTIFTAKLPMRDRSRKSSTADRAAVLFPIFNAGGAPVAYPKPIPHPVPAMF